MPAKHIDSEMQTRTQIEQASSKILHISLWIVQKEDTLSTGWIWLYPLDSLIGFPFCVTVALT